MNAFSGLTYPNLRLEDNTVDNNDLEARIPLDNGRHQLDPKYDLGVLEQLPREILDEILIQLDLRSLTDFRRINQRATQIVDSVPQYRAILQHSPSSLRAILAIETGRLISCEDLVCTLRTAVCEDCHDFGGFIYLLTCKRVCFLCFTEDVKYFPVLATDFKRKFGMSLSSTTDMLRMRSVPGCYSPNEKRCRARTTLYDHESAHQAAVKHHGSEAAMVQYMAKVASDNSAAYDEKIVLWLRDRNGPKPRQTPRPPPDGQDSNPRRFMAIVRAPYLDPLTKLSDWGFHCIGCENQYHARPMHWRRKFSKHTFDEHIRECGKIEDGSHCGQQR